MGVVQGVGHLSNGVANTIEGSEEREVMKLSTILEISVATLYVYREGMQN